MGGGEISRIDLRPQNLEVSVDARRDPRFLFPSLRTPVNPVLSHPANGLGPAGELAWEAWRHMRRSIALVRYDFGVFGFRNEILTRMRVYTSGKTQMMMGYSAQLATGISFDLSSLTRYENIPLLSPEGLRQYEMSLTYRF
ncbi:MAG: hypothetical protein HY465_01755 [Deltaproteobacteria bacterium]|nr:hypothetical protein [Deltaproteobacteria bacterium]